MDVRVQIVVGTLRDEVLASLGCPSSHAERWRYGGDHAAIAVGRDARGANLGVYILQDAGVGVIICLLYTSPSPRDGLLSRMPSSA